MPVKTMSYRQRKFIQRFLAALAAIFFVSFDLFLPAATEAAVPGLLPFLSDVILFGTTAELATVAAPIVVGGLVIGAAYYYWAPEQTTQAQAQAKDKYCTANPHDSVCVKLVIGPGGGLPAGDPGCEVYSYIRVPYPYTIGSIQAPDAQCGYYTVYTINGNPISRGVYPTEVKEQADWKDWPEGTRQAATNLLKNDDLNGILQTGSAGNLTAGQSLPNGAYVSPAGGQPVQFQPGPLTVSDNSSQPTPPPSPSPSGMLPFLSDVILFGTTAELATVAAPIVVGGLVVGAAYYYWAPEQTTQAQAQAKDKYCTANPHDSVCVKLVIGPGGGLPAGDPGCKVYSYIRVPYPYTIGSIQAPDAQCGYYTVYTINGNPISRGVYPTEVKEQADWKDWPQDKQQAATLLLNDDDLNKILQTGNAGNLTAGQSFPNGVYVSPGEGQPFTLKPGPLTLTNNDPNPIPLTDPSLSKFTEEQRNALKTKFMNPEYRKYLDFDPNGKKCAVGDVPRAGFKNYGPDTVDVADYYSTYVTGSEQDFLVIPPEGGGALFDGRTPNTTNVWETKYDYSKLLDNKKTFILNIQLSTWDKDKTNDLLVAERCGYHLEWAFSNETIANMVRNRWGNIPPVNYIALPPAQQP